MSKLYKITGRVVDQDTGQGIPGLRIEAWDKDIDSDDYLGKATTKRDGSFEIQFTAEQFQGWLLTEKKPDLYFIVFDTKGERIADTKKDVRWNYEVGETPIVIRLKAPQDESEKDNEINTFSGQLYDKKENIPLVGYIVRFIMLDKRRLPRVWGQGTSDRDGFFTVRPTVSVRLPAESRLSLLLQVVLDERRDRVYEREVEFVVGQVNRIGKIELELADEQQTPPTIARLDEALALNIPQNVHDKLAEREIRTLDDVRRSGGIGNIEGLDLSEDDPLRQTIDAHAFISVAVDDSLEIQKLVKKGFVSLHSIANTNRNRFIDQVKGDVGEVKAAKIHAKVVAQTSVLNNLLAGHLANRANGYDYVSGPMQDVDLPDPPCQCEDAESAVSPLAYLTDLLRYTMDHVTRDDVTIEISDLTNLLHQPFGRLPTSYESVEKRVRQARIAVQVLRAIAPLPEKQEELQAAEKAYRLDVYQNLLLRMGTSLAEIRMAHRADTETKQRIADKLGLDDVSRLDELRIEPEELSERKIQEIFGLANTKPAEQDPLAEAPAPQIEEWRLNFLRALWKKEDWPDEELAENQPVIDPDVIGPDDMRWPFPDNPFVVWVPGHNLNRFYLLWLKRREWVDDCLRTLGERLVPIRGERMQVMLQSMLDPVQYDTTSQTPWTNIGPFDALDTTTVDDLDILYTQLSTGDQGKVDQAIQRLQQDLALAPDAFCRLVELKYKHRAWLLKASDDKLTADEWRDFSSILVQAQKERFYIAWQVEEQDQNITLSIQDFWISAREPAIGDWPPIAFGQTPLIDPETISLKDLPERKAGGRAREKWQERKSDIETIADALRSTLPDYEAALLTALGNTDPSDPSSQILPHDLDVLKAELTSPDSEIVVAAEQKIKDDFYMLLEDFVRLMAILARYQESDPAKKPTEIEQRDFIRILTSAQKQKRKYPEWLQVEQDLNNHLPYWHARKAMLPPWRAGLEQRAKWQNALRLKCLPPIIDPDLIDAGDIARMVDGDPAYDLWQERQDAIKDKLEWIKGERIANSLEDVLTVIIQATGQELEALAQDEQDGHRIDAYLKQLRLSRPAFAYLLTIVKLLGQNETILDSEWEEVDAILLQAWKESVFSQWREQEKAPDNDLIQSPKYFVVEYTAERSLPEWRAQHNALRNWQDKLQARYDQQASIRQGIQKTISDTEELTLPRLRDALVRAMDPGNDENITDILSQQFFISMRESGCHITTRVSQAIVSIQGLLMALRMDQLQSMYSDLRLEAPAFDADWKWMGSYATWRAAMFVFIYPENLLVPTLRSHSTPLFQSISETLLSTQDVSSLTETSETILNNYLALKSLQIVAQGSINMRSFSHDLEIDEFEGFIYTIAKAYADVENRIFWSCNHSGNFSLTEGQSYWKEFPILDNPEIIGATTYNGHLYLFLKKSQTVQFLRYNLENQGYDRDNNQIIGHWQYGESYSQLPSLTTSVHIIPRTMNLPPKLALCQNNSTIHELALEENGTSWDSRVEISDLRTMYGASFGIRTVVHIDSDKYAILNKSYGDSWVLYVNDGDDFADEPQEILGGDENGDLIGFFGNVLFFNNTVENRKTAMILKWSTGHFVNTFTYRLSRDDIDNVPSSTDITFVDNFQRGVTIKILQTTGGCSSIYLIQFDSDSLITEGKPVMLSNALSDDIYARDSVSVEELNQRYNYLYEMDFKNRTLSMYIKEFFYFFPTVLGLKFLQLGNFSLALDWYRTVYDYTAPLAQRKRYPGLKLEEEIDTSYQRNIEDWLANPLKPHATAATRANAYTRYTIMSIVQCLIEYADNEFTRDTVESLPRARDLYLHAEKLLNSPELVQTSSECDEIMGQLEIDLGNLGNSSQAFCTRIKNRVENTSDRHTRRAMSKKITQIANSNQSRSRKISQVWQVVEECSAPSSDSVSQVLQRKSKVIEDLQKRVMASDNVYDAVLMAMFGGVKEMAPQIGLVLSLASSSFGFCIPKNPIADILRTKVRINLIKLRTCKNIAGVTRSIDAFAAPTDTQTGMPYIAGGQIVLPGISAVQPSQYRYKTLAAKADQLLTFAQQMEASLLAALEKEAHARYNIFKARQELDMAKAGVKLQKLRVTEAEQGVTVTRAQKKSATTRYDHYGELIDSGWLTTEDDALNTLAAVVTLHGTIAAGYAAYAAAGFITSNPAAYAAAQQALQYTASALQTTASILSTVASYERRAQEWQFQLDLASNDMELGNKQIEMAEAHVDVVTEERRITELGVQNAQDTLEFLNNEFTDDELYQWMGNVLRQIYAYFLQQATSMAQAASNQLAFERHEPPPPFIQTDYWEIPNQAQIATAKTNEERQGLLGAERLRQDLEKLNLYAFQTDERRLHLTKKISLAAMSPWEFARFRENGVFYFATPMSLFDRDYPGHYMRLIHNVKVSVIGLISPVAGINATLTSDRISRVVIGGDLYQIAQIAHGPNQVALSSPQEATGIFELDPQTEIMRPFEGIGVDTAWEFCMPKAANQIDYNAIADIIVTLEYTALNSFDFKQQVIASLSSRFTADLAYSFKHNLPDQWYQFHNPEQSGTPMTVRFETVATQFPPNLSNFSIAEITLYFSSQPGATFEIQIDHLKFQEQGQPGWLGGSATTFERTVSTRGTNAVNLGLLKGKSPFGVWEMALQNSPDVQRFFSEEKITDILLVITYMADTPGW